MKLKIKITRKQLDELMFQNNIDTIALLAEQIDLVPESIYRLFRSYTTTLKTAKLISLKLKQKPDDLFKVV